MGFLDNSGDIILDAVLTDLGRKRLAQGNFQITKFALGDDEIDYGLYDKNHPSGSAYYDLEILQSPVLEAFTNNMSSMKSRLISYSSNDLLYLPVIELNETVSPRESNSNAYIVAVDQETMDTFTSSSAVALSTITGYLNGNAPLSSAPTVGIIRSDQGLDTTELSPSDSVNPLLLETQYFVQFDNRFGTICSPTQQLDYVALDDDNIATYVVTMNGGEGAAGAGAVTQMSLDTTDSSISGPRGTKVELKIAASLELKTSTFLFNQLGSQGSTKLSGPGELLAANYKFIDTTLRISGVSTGYTLDIPIRLVKKM
tara:strand:- start:1223 stop:2164 length:942 start_codon:yes stop_codon:yes gene_type:complete